jgi:hypothetical protein
MGMNDYANALTAAQEELETVNEQIVALTQRQAQLQQTVLALKTLTGKESDDETSLTEKIRLVVRAANEPLTGAEVIAALEAMGVDKKQVASITTILSRDKDFTRTPRKDGQLGYLWTPFRKGLIAMQRAKLAAEREKK